MDRLYKTFFGQVIDLSKITSITPIQIVEDWDHLNRIYFIQFKIHLNKDEVIYRKKIKYVNKKSEEIPTVEGGKYLLKKEKGRYTHDGGGGYTAWWTEYKMKDGTYKSPSFIIDNNLHEHCLIIKKTKKKYNKIIDKWNDYVKLRDGN